MSALELILIVAAIAMIFYAGQMVFFHNRRHDD